MFFFASVGSPKHGSTGHTSVTMRCLKSRAPDQSVLDWGQVIKKVTISGRRLVTDMWVHRHWWHACKRPNVGVSMSIDLVRYRVACVLAGFESLVTVEMPLKLLQLFFYVHLISAHIWTKGRNCGSSLQPCHKPLRFIG
jgi:hypothetical protein